MVWLKAILWKIVQCSGNYLCHVGMKWLGSSSSQTTRGSFFVNTSDYSIIKKPQLAGHSRGRKAMPFSSCSIQQPILTIYLFALFNQTVSFAPSAFLPGCPPSARNIGARILQRKEPLQELRVIDRWMCPYGESQREG